MTALESTLIKSMETEPSFWQTSFTPDGKTLNCRHRSKGVLVQSRFGRAWSSKLRHGTWFALRWHHAALAKHREFDAANTQAEAESTRMTISKIMGV